MGLLEYMLLAFGGHAIHLLKLYSESLRRKEEFINKSFLASEMSNLIAIPMLVWMADYLPPELFVMSPLGAVIIGTFASSMLAGFINVKKPKEIDSVG
jgi:hypothetical protein